MQSSFLFGSRNYLELYFATDARLTLSIMYRVVSPVQSDARSDAQFGRGIRLALFKSNILPQALSVCAPLFGELDELGCHLAGETLLSVLFPFIAFRRV